MGVLRAAKWLAICQFVSLFLTFLKNMVLARLLSVEDMGVATLLAMFVSTVQQITAIGIPKFVVQYTAATKDTLLGTVHCYALVRGLCVAGVAVTISPWITSAFSIPQANFAFALLSLSILLGSLTNVDIYLQQRELYFKSMNISELVGQLSGLVTAAIGAIYSGSYHAALAAILVQGVASTFTSHLMARQRYAVDFDWRVLRALGSFGTPLLLNGTLLAATINGDRFVIAMSAKLNPASAVSLADFAVYGVAFGFVFAVTMGFLRVATNLMLPAITKVKHDPTLLADRVLLFGQAIAAFACITTLFFSILGNHAISVIYGGKYHIAPFLIGLISIGLSLRTLRSVPNSVAMAFGDTWNMLYANIVRSIAIPTSIFAIVYGWGIAGVVVVTVLAESMAVVSSCLLLKYDLGGKPSLLASYARLYLPVAFTCTIKSAIPAESSMLSFCMAIGTCLIALTLFIIYAPDLIRTVREQIQSRGILGARKKLMNAK